MANSWNPMTSFLRDLIVYVFVIFESPCVPATSSDSAVPETEKLCLEGRVQQKLECRPYGNAVFLTSYYHTVWVYNVLSSPPSTADKGYMQLKLQSFRKAAQPTRLVQQLDRVVPMYKPVSNHKHNVSSSCSGVCTSQSSYTPYLQLLFNFCLHLNSSRLSMRRGGRQRVRKLVMIRKLSWKWCMLPLRSISTTTLRI